MWFCLGRRTCISVRSRQNYDFFSAYRSRLKTKYIHKSIARKSHSHLRRATTYNRSVLKRENPQSVSHRKKQWKVNFICDRTKIATDRPWMCVRQQRTRHRTCECYCEKQPIFSDRTLFCLSSSVRTGIASTHIHNSESKICVIIIFFLYIGHTIELRKICVLKEIQTSTEKKSKNRQIVCEWFFKWTFVQNEIKKIKSCSLRYWKKVYSWQKYLLFWICNYIFCCYFFRVCKLWRENRMKTLNHT